ncbi:NADPH-dependent FMN reductase [Pseudorhodoplanes sp.]|uniref:NADPH-dependent FMN reductase n=1 Tax=Pseudorhodoplanes sp. TaxID=1934341 RepID=UPI003D099B03
MIDLVFLSASSQIGSVHRRLATAAAALTNREFKDVAKATLIDLNNLDLPNFSERNEATNETPIHATTLRNQLSQADGMFMSSDEYTGAYSALLKNALRWLSSLGAKSETPLQGMPIALCGASSRGAGSLRGQPALAQLLGELGAHVIPQYLELGTAVSLLDDQGQFHQRFEKQLAEGCLHKLVQAGMARRSQHMLVVE